MKREELSQLIGDLTSRPPPVITPLLIPESNRLIWEPARFSLYTRKKEGECQDNMKLIVNSVPKEIWWLICTFADPHILNPLVTLILSCKMFYNKFYQDENIAKKLDDAKWCKLLTLIKPLEPPHINLFDSIVPLDLPSVAFPQFPYSREMNRMIDLMDSCRVEKPEERQEVCQPGEKGFIMRGVYPG